MEQLSMRDLVCCAALSFAALSSFAKAVSAHGPVELRVDTLREPLGIDDSAPSFSWQLRDPASGARQSAYEVQISSSATGLTEGNVDVWDSGRVFSSQSLNIRYQGSALAPSKRYFWHVRIWDSAGKPYPESETSWWETGLMTKSGWHAAWIGYETKEEIAVRNARAAWIASPGAQTLASEKLPEQHFAYRAAPTIDGAVRSATLYATCEDTVSAWVNGTEVLKSNPLPPYKQMPWKKYVRADVTKQLTNGTNSLALECVHYVVNPNGMAAQEAPPLSATLYVEFEDGRAMTVASETAWKSAIHAPEGWHEKNFDDSGWPGAVAWKPVPGPQSAPLGHPWIPDSVKSLRSNFELSKQIKSARLYATSMGAYEMFLNGKRISEDLLAPGWTDYRERVKYQTYDVTAMLAAGKNAIAALLGTWLVRDAARVVSATQQLWRHATRAAGAAAHRVCRRRRGMGQ
jgi:alpha-L-rhamnosidase